MSAISTPTLIGNLSLISSIKDDIRDAISAKGVDMTSVPFSEFASKIGDIQTGGTFVTETLNVSANNTYYPGQGVDGFSEVVVNVPQSVEGFSERQITEMNYNIVSLNNNASYVSQFAFANNTSLQVINLPDCRQVGSSAFSGCGSLTQISLPNCVSVYNSAFVNCYYLSSVNLPKCTNLQNYAFASCIRISSVSLPVCTTLANSVFYSCSSLSELNLPVCTVIGGNTFRNCTGLVSISLPVCIQIGGSAFMGCSRIQEVELPVCTYFGGAGVFSGCSGLLRVSLPVIGGLNQNAFAGCANLSEVTLAVDTYQLFPYSNNLNNTPFTKGGTGVIYVASETYSKWITSTGWSSLSSYFVSFPASLPVLSFSDGLVYGRTRYMSNNYLSFLGITNTNQVQKLSLTEIDTLPFGMFNTYYSLTEIDLPACTYLSDRQFSSCTNLTSVNLPACTSLGYGVFYMCNLSSVDLPVCRYISGTFNGCSGLTSVSLPACEIISGAAFSGCSNLRSVVLPVCSAIYGDTAFRYCSNFNITLGYSGVCYFSNTLVFNQTALEHIYVPSSLVDAYKSAQGWSYYSSKIFAIPE